MYNQMRRKTKISQIDYFIGSVQIDNQAITWLQDWKSQRGIMKNVL